MDSVRVKARVKAKVKVKVKVRARVKAKVEVTKVEANKVDNHNLAENPKNKLFKCCIKSSEWQQIQ